MKRNMKKIASVLLVAMLALCLTACGGGKDNGGAVEIADATEILTTVWGTYAEDEMFAAAGGDSENMSMEGPAKFDVSKTEELAYLLNFPAELADKIDDAASLMHMMNANTFTAGAYHVADAADMSAVVDAIKDKVMNNHWMCGFPETLIIVQVGDSYVVSAYGNGELIDNFQSKLLAAYKGVAEVVVEESLM